MCSSDLENEMKWLSVILLCATLLSACAVPAQDRPPPLQQATYVGIAAVTAGFGVRYYLKHKKKKVEERSSRVENYWPFRSQDDMAARMRFLRQRPDETLTNERPPLDDGDTFIGRTITSR